MEESPVIRGNLICNLIPKVCESVKRHLDKWKTSASGEMRFKLSSLATITECCVAYMSVTSECVLQSVKKVKVKRCWRLSHNNDPKQTPKSTMNGFNKHELRPLADLQSQHGCGQILNVLKLKLCLLFWKICVFKSV